MRTRSLKVIDMAVHEVATTTADQTIEACALQMRREHVGSLVVIDQDRKPVGMITDRDITIQAVALRADPSTTKVGDIMAKPVVTARTNEGMVVALDGDRLRLNRFEQMNALLIVVAHQDAVAFVKATGYCWFHHLTSCQSEHGRS